MANARVKLKPLANKSTAYEGILERVVRKTYIQRFPDQDRKTENKYEISDPKQEEGVKATR